MTAWGGSRARNESWPRSLSQQRPESLIPYLMGDEAAVLFCGTVYFMVMFSFFFFFTVAAGPGLATYSTVKWARDGRTPASWGQGGAGWYSDDSSR